MRLESPTYRELIVTERGAGRRLDRFLAARFSDRSRTELARGLKAGQVRDERDQPLRASSIVSTGQVLRLYLPGLAPSEPPPPFPTILFEDERVAIVNKPPRMLAHPAGSDFVWSMVGLAKARWPEHRVDLVHRLDRDTSGTLLLTKDLDANRILKDAFQTNAVDKHYLAICRGHIPWDDASLRGPIGPSDGPIRVQMVIRPDGLSARTDVRVLERRGELSLVACRLFTGRTHQIRVHLAGAGAPILGDRLYALPVEDALVGKEQGWTDELLAKAGAPRQALHAELLCLDVPGVVEGEFRAPLPDDMAAWWAAAK